MYGMSHILMKGADLGLHCSFCFIIWRDISLHIIPKKEGYSVPHLLFLGFGIFCRNDWPTGVFLWEIFMVGLSV